MNAALTGRCDVSSATNGDVRFASVEICEDGGRAMRDDFYAMQWHRVAGARARPSRPVHWRTASERHKRKHRMLCTPYRYGNVALVAAGFDNACFDLHRIPSSSP
jgi:hypothetical protein